MQTINMVFTKINETTRNYTWEYSKEEYASHLFDINEEVFALLTYCQDIDEETGAMLDLRISEYIRFRLYSKQTHQVVETFALDDMSNLPSKLSNKSWGSQIKEVNRIDLSAGKIYISEGNLVFDSN